jgi:hypothetical protein
MKSLTTIQAMRNWNWSDAQEAYLTIIGSVCSLILVLVFIILFKCNQDSLRKYLARNAENQSDTQRRQQSYRLDRLIMKNQCLYLSRGMGESDDYVSPRVPAGLKRTTM